MRLWNLLGTAGRGTAVQADSSRHGQVGERPNNFFRAECHQTPADRQQRSRERVTADQRKPSRAVPTRTCEVGRHGAEPAQREALCEPPQDASACRTDAGRERDSPTGSADGAGILRPRVETGMIAMITRREGQRNVGQGNQGTDTGWRLPLLPPFPIPLPCPRSEYPGELRVASARSRIDLRGLGHIDRRSHPLRVPRFPTRMISPTPGLPQASRFVPPVSAATAIASGESFRTTALHNASRRTGHGGRCAIAATSSGQMPRCFTRLSRTESSPWINTISQRLTKGTDDGRVCDGWLAPAADKLWFAPGDVGERNGRGRAIDQRAGGPGYRFREYGGRCGLDREQVLRLRLAKPPGR